MGPQLRPGHGGALYAQNAPRIARRLLLQAGDPNLDLNPVGDFKVGVNTQFVFVSMRQPDLISLPLPLTLSGPSGVDVSGAQLSPEPEGRPAGESAHPLASLAHSAFPQVLLRLRWALYSSKLLLVC
jgi:hypothetical protein